MHIFGGGFTAFITSYLAAKDSEVKISLFQFFCLSILIVIALGVGNEIIEYIAQNHFNILFSNSINDTWLDLISNIIGIFIGGIFVFPFAKTKFK